MRTFFPILTTKILFYVKFKCHLIIRFSFDDPQFRRDFPSELLYFVGFIYIYAYTPHDIWHCIVDIHESLCWQMLGGSAGVKETKHLSLKNYTLQRQELLYTWEFLFLLFTQHLVQCRYLVNTFWKIKWRSECVVENGI